MVRDPIWLRVERLTRLARKVAVWETIEVEVILEPPHVAYVRGVEDNGYETLLLDTRGDEDALEEALTVLSGELPPWVERLAQAWESSTADATTRAVYQRFASELRDRAKAG